MNPISMSIANAIAPELPVIITDWTIAPASMKERKLATGGNCGRSTARPAPAVWIASRAVGKIDERGGELRPPERLHDRPSPQGEDHPGVGRQPLDHSAAASDVAGFLLRPLEVLAGLLHEDVVERGLHQVQGLDVEPLLVEGDDDRADLRAAVLELDHQRPVADGQRPSEARQHLLRARLLPLLVHEAELQVRSPDLRLQRLRCPLRD